jgi:hypothetical protein
MTGYPGWSHALVAYTAAALGVNPLRSMQIWTTIFLITGCFVMAVRLTFQAKGPPSVFGTGITVIYLAACAYAGFALRGHIERNYFFPQLAGTVIAIAGLAALQNLDWDATLASLLVVFLGGVVLPNVHLLPAMWFTFAGLIILCLTSRSWRMASLQCALIAMTNLFLWHVAAGEMVNMSNSNGWFLIRFTQLSDHGTYLAIGLGLVFCALSLALLHHLRRNPLAVSRRRLAQAAGLVAVCLLICLQALAHLVLHVGSVYSITKYLYLLGTELAVFLVGVRWTVPLRIHSSLQRHPLQAAMGCFALLFLSQGPFLSTPYNQSLLMRLRGRLLALQTASVSGQRSYPQISSLGYDQNYYLAIAIMRIPHDERTVRWLLRGTTGETPFVWPDAAFVPLPNSDFESGALAPWRPYLSAEPKVTGEKVHGGKFALAEAAGDGSVYQDVSGLVPGSDYRFTAFVSGSLDGTAAAQIALWEPDSGPAALSPAVTPGPTWQVVSQSVTAGASGTIRLHLFRHSGRGAIYWDDARLVLTR